MEKYYKKRIISYLAHHISRGKTREEVRRMALSRRDRWPAEWIDECLDDAEQCAANVERINAEFARRKLAKDAARAGGYAQPKFDPLRLCDLPGVRFPKVGG